MSCFICFSPGRNHSCAGRVDYRKAKDQITEWEFAESSTIGLPDKASPTQYIYTKLSVRKFYKQQQPLSARMIRDCEYVFQSDERKKIYSDDGHVSNPPRSENHTIISARTILRNFRLNEQEFRGLQRRWFDSVVNQHSSRNNKDMRQCLDALTNEMALINYLQSTGQRVVDAHGRPTLADTAGPEIHVRFTKGLVDFHDCDNGTAMMFGKSSVMKEMANTVTDRLQDPAFNNGLADVACAMIALPLSCIMNKTEAEVVQAIREEIETNNPTIFSLVETHFNNNKISTNSHLSLNLIEGLKVNGQWWGNDGAWLCDSDKKFCPWLASDIHIDPSDISILLGVWNWPDKCEVSISGGKRSLGETSLECALRETLEETTVDLTHARVRARHQHSVSQDDIGTDWMLSLHLQLNLNCYIFTHRSLFL